MAVLLTIFCALLTHVAMKRCRGVQASASMKEAGLTGFIKFFILATLYSLGWAVAWSNWELVLSLMDALEPGRSIHNAMLAAGVFCTVIVLSLCFYLRRGSVHGCTEGSRVSSSWAKLQRRPRIAPRSEKRPRSLKGRAKISGRTRSLAALGVGQDSVPPLLADVPEPYVAVPVASGFLCCPTPNCERPVVAERGAAGPEAALLGRGGGGARTRSCSDGAGRPP